MSVDSIWEGEPPGEPHFVNTGDETVFWSKIANIIMRLTRRFALPILASPSQFWLSAPNYGFALKFRQIY